MRRAAFPRLAACAFGAMLAAGAPASAEGEAVPARPIFLDIAPADLKDSGAQMPGDTAVTAPGVPVRIDGFVAREAAGAAVTVTVTPPQTPEPYAPEPDKPEACPARDGLGAPATVTGLFRAEPPEEIAATADASGRFEVEYTPTVEGEHEVAVEAAVAGETFRGERSFEVVTLEPEEDCKDIPQEEIEQVAADLTGTVCDAIDAVAARIGELPPSPQRDELSKRLREFRAELTQGLPCGAAPRWVSALRHVTDIRNLAPELRPPTNRVVVQAEGWLAQAKKAQEEAPRAIAEITRGNVACDQLDVVINGLKFIDFYIGLIVKPEAFLTDWAKENLPSKLLYAFTSAGKSSARVKEGIELGMKGVTSYKPKYGAGKVRIGAAGFDLALTHGKMTNGILTYAVARVFEAICQTFQGPVTGSMWADFRHEGDIWWHYDIKIAGQLTLRYPANAKGEVIALTGEFLGNATLLDSWDNAVPVLYPEMAQSTVFRTLRIEPLALNSIPGVFEKNFGLGGGSDVPDFNPFKSSIDQGGAIAQFVMTPAFFRVPVKGELRGDKLKLELLPAARDFDDLRVKVVSIILPVLSMWPDVIDYALPYKGAHFIMTRAMNDGPYIFDVRREGETMKIGHVFTRQKETAETLGVYALTIEACNPGC